MAQSAKELEETLTKLFRTYLERCQPEKKRRRLDRKKIQNGEYQGRFFAIQRRNATLFRNQILQQSFLTEFQNQDSVPAPCQARAGWQDHPDCCQYLNFSVDGIEPVAPNTMFSSEIRVCSLPSGVMFIWATVPKSAQNSS